MCSIDWELENLSYRLITVIRVIPGVGFSIRSCGRVVLANSIRVVAFPQDDLSVKQLSQI